MATAPTIGTLRIADAPERWSRLGFAVDAAGCCRVGTVVLEFGLPGRGIVGWTLTGAGPPGEVEGIDTDFAAPTTGRPIAHPNAALSVDHVVMATPDVERTLAALSSMGMRVRAERTSPSARQAFIRHGEAVLEVVGPASARGDGPAMLWGVTVTVADLAGCASRLADALGPVRAAVQPGRQIAVVRRQAGLSARLALMSPRLDRASAS